MAAAPPTIAALYRFNSFHIRAFGVAISYHIALYQCHQVNRSSDRGRVELSGCLREGVRVRTYGYEARDKKSTQRNNASHYEHETAHTPSHI